MSQPACSRCGAALQSDDARCAACGRAIREEARSLGLTATAASMDGATIDPAPPLGDVSGRRVAHYVIESVLGTGGMGVVYAAFDPKLGRRVALKLVRAELATDAARDRLLREARSLAKLTHPNVVTVHDVGVYEGDLYVAMELVPGRSLREWLMRRRRWRAKVQVFVAAGRGLAAAHAAGLVHRDFKPDNVLVGDDDRPRVADFGLARALAPEMTPPHAGVATDGLGSAARDVPLGSQTVEGSLAGTPAYMAPEQFTGANVDARTDQFAFCVALFEALHEARPFAGRTLAELRANVTAGKLVLPRSGPRVPSWLTRALRRGMSVDPSARFATMEALLAAIDRDPARVWRRVAVVGLTTSVIVASVVTASVLRERTARLCRGGEARLAGVWDDAQRAAVRDALLASGKPFALGAWKGTRRALDAYARTFVAAHTDACEATRLRGEQSEEILDLRVQCLERRRKELRALVSVLSTRDPMLVDRSVQAAHALTVLEVCADIDELKTRVKPPSDPLARAEAEAVRASLVEAKVLRDAGRFDAALPIASALAARADKVGYRPLQAEVLALRGDIEARKGDVRAAEETLRAALLAAESGRHDRVAAQVATSLAWVVGYQRAEHAAGRWWADFAGAAVERVGGDPDLEARRRDILGLVLSSAGKYAESQREHEAALASLQRAYGPDSLDAATALTRLANAMQHLAKYPAALAHNERALAIRERHLGAEHPAVAASLNNVAVQLENLGRYADALPKQQRAHTILERALGSEHPHVADSHANLATLFLRLGRLEDAVRNARRSLAIDEMRFGARHPRAAHGWNLLGSIEARRNAADALAAFRRAHAITEAALGAEHPDLSRTLVNESMVLCDLKRFDAALGLARRALAIGEKSLGAKHVGVGDSLRAVADALLGLRRRAEALPFVARAVAIFEQQGGDPIELARSRFTLARALDRGQASRALGHARASRDVFAKAVDGYRKELQAVERWLAARRAP
jgi:tetratricopeptide (TPR) repeat protein